MLVGKSGTGKSTIANVLYQKYGLKTLESYTTRPRRWNNETGHVFVTDEDFNQLKDIVAFTNFNGYRYCATQEQIDKADVYIIDPAGVESFYQNYNGSKGAICIELLASWRARYKRMRCRGDTRWMALSRLLHDRKVFKDVPARCWINTENRNIECTVEEVMKFVEFWGAFDKEEIRKAKIINE